jgi:hypothetical protein
MVLEQEERSLHTLLQEISTRSSDLGKYWAEQVLHVPSDEMLTCKDFTRVFTPNFRGGGGLDRIHEYLRLFMRGDGLAEDSEIDLKLTADACPVVESMVEIVLGNQGREYFLTLIERRKSTAGELRNTRQGDVKLRAFEHELRQVLSNHPIMALQSQFDVVQHLIAFFSQALQLWIVESEDPIKAAREWLESML